MNKVIITITGAAGNIAYSLIFRILSGNIFPNDTKIQLNLLDIPSSKTILKGVKYEIEDCAFESLDSIVETDDPETAFGDSNYILLVGAKPRIKGMQRSDLLLDNANIFKSQGEYINASSKKSSKIIVVGNPANTNALIVHKHTPNISDGNITSLMRLDQNRAKSIFASKVNIHVDDIKKLVVWGNHSATQYPDLSNVCIEGVNNPKSRYDDKWVYDSFIPRVQKRGAEIIECRGKSSAASAASAVYDHLNVIVNGSNDWESMGIISDNKYDISTDVFYSFPLTFDSNNLSIVDNLSISDQSRSYLKKTEKELLDERDVIKDLL
tara:strand:+ start:52786 stop:53757 length:972 start_codon:yes stop_codon:yes gene_type:complete